MNTIIKGAALISISILLTTGCSKSVRESEAGPMNAKNKIVIIAFPSEFKNSIAEKLVERYKSRARVRLIPMSSINKIDYRDYNAIVIIDALRAWKIFNTRTRFFIRRIRNKEDRKKVVLFLSAGNPKKNYRILGVDSITSASENYEAIIEGLSKKIDSLIQ